MAKTRQKRRRKHRGTQAGTVERSGRRAGASTRAPQTREEKRAAAKRRREERQSRPPTWRATLGRAGIAAVVVFVGLTVLLERQGKSGGQAAVGALALAALSLVIYIPLGYMLDKAMYTRAQRRRAGDQPPGRNRRAR